MHGGIKVYRGTAAAARNYLDADRSRADDYYLAEGNGTARRYTTGLDAPVGELAALTGDAYEAWVAGLDPETGEPRGRLRRDAAGVRFVEVVVNGPKSWSLAAELHPDVAAAYEAAQDRAAEQIIGWLGQHATTRVGPRGAQVAVPVQLLEAVTVRHYTSRAGDPHRHLHLQVNARVFAAGKWRGIDTVAVRDSIAALNGIGHAAVACDPGFRAALAAHGYTLTDDGEITQLAEYIGPFSKRAAQIGRLLDRYEAAWRAEHPGQEPGPGLRRAWDARAWAEDRPDKVIPRDGSQLRERWLEELAGLGYRDRDQPTQLAAALPGTIDRDAAAAEVLARLGAARSAWNAADVRGQVEQLLARTGLLAEPAARAELAEDLTARALDQCIPLRSASTPEHVRALSSQRVLDVEADLTARLAARGAIASTAIQAASVDRLDGGLDAGQRAAVAVLAGKAALVVIEGAAGAGKTSLLAAARDELAARGARMVVVTPTRKAAQVAGAELRAPAGSAGWLAWQYGFRWEETGTWTRELHDPAPAALLRRGDLLLVDEAGMLDQDTARALLTIADETGARIALLGDRHQLPAVGRGGVLELAHRCAHPDAVLNLNTVHRFVRASGGDLVPDEEYAALSLAMRAGEDPGAVFDQLHARGQLAVYRSEIERVDALAGLVAAERADGERPAVVVDTREHAAALNTAIRAELIDRGVVEDARVAVTGDGQRLGRGDVIVTRRNDPHLAVANRQAWTIARVHRDGRLTVTAAGHGTRELPAHYVRAHVELGYAVTGYGAQGETTDLAHLVLTEHTSAAAAYVALTRGRCSNTAHLVAADLDDAREQWITTFGRDRADLGPGHAAGQAARAAAGYTAAPEPDPTQREPAIAGPASRDEVAGVLDQLTAAWTEQLSAHRELQRAERTLAATEAEAAWWARCAPVLGPLQQARDAAYTAHQHAERAAADSFAVHLLADATDRAAARLRTAWDSDLAHATEAAQTVAAGPGRLGLHRGRVRAAEQHLDAWTSRWAPVLTDIGLDPTTIRRHPAGYPSTVAHVADALHQHAQRMAAAQHPDHAARLRARDHAADAYHRAAAAYQHAHRELAAQSHLPCYDTGAADQLPTLREQATAARDRADRVDAQVHRLEQHPAITGQPDPDSVLATARQHWQHALTAAHAARLQQAAAQRTAARPFDPAHMSAPETRHQDPALGL